MGKYSNETGEKKAEIWFKLVPNLSWFDSYWKSTPDSGHLIGHCWSMFKEEGGKVLVESVAGHRVVVVAAAGKADYRVEGGESCF